MCGQEIHQLGPILACIEGVGKGAAIGTAKRSIGGAVEGWEHLEKDAAAYLHGQPAACGCCMPSWQQRWSLLRKRRWKKEVEEEASVRGPHVSVWRQLGYFRPYENTKAFNHLRVGPMLLYT